jgi:hypothetical protein
MRFGKHMFISSCENTTGNASLFEDATYRHNMEIASTILTVIGVLGNVVTLVTIGVNKKLRSVTYTIIACIAPADAIALIFGYCFIYRVDDVTNSYALRLVVRGINLAGEHCSAAHMVFLGAIRCLLIARPVWSLLNLTPKRIVFISGLLWLFSIAFASGLTVFFHISHRGYVDKNTVVYTVFIVGFYLLCFPLILISVFHCIKIRSVLRSSAIQRVSLSSNMSKVFILILVVYAVSCTADLVYYIVILRKYLIKRSLETDQSLYYAMHALYFVWMIHFSMNPFLYFFVSPQVRRLIYNMCARHYL